MMNEEQLEATVMRAASELQAKVGEKGHVIVMALDGEDGKLQVARLGNPAD